MNVISLFPLPSLPKNKQISWTISQLIIGFDVTLAVTRPRRLNHCTVCGNSVRLLLLFTLFSSFMEFI